MSVACPVRGLILRCCEDDPQAWVDLWNLVEDEVAGVLRRLLWSRGADPGLADDLRQELYFYLREDAAQRLGAFRGAAEAQLRRFVAAVARHFAQNRLLSLRRARAREAEALRSRARPGHPGPTEAEVLAACSELIGLMAERDRSRFRRILGRAGIAIGPGAPSGRPGGGPGPRTYRRWSEGLYRRYAGRVV
jgi:hypothetical protein